MTHRFLFLFENDIIAEMKNALINKLDTERHI